MPPTLFFSYSHVDEGLRNQLETHLSALKRQELIASWHDRRITVGSNIGNSIDANLDLAELILLLISPDFIASDYCYEREMQRAMERHASGAARVIPIILRPCDWHDLPFSGLLAAPRDGKAITQWANIDEAFLDVVRAIKAALKESAKTTQNAQPLAPISRGSESSAPGPNLGETVNKILLNTRSSNLRIKKDFTELDKDRFRQEGFDFIARFFENSMRELVQRNPDSNLEYRYQRIDPIHFTAALYSSGRKVCKGAASISDRAIGRDAITYLMDDAVSSGGMNEAVYVKADDQMLYFEPLGMQSYGQDKARLSAQGAAELFWGLFIRPLQ